MTVTMKKTNDTNFRAYLAQEALSNPADSSDSFIAAGTAFTDP